MALLHYYTTDSIGAGRRILPVSGDTYIIKGLVTLTAAAMIANRLRNFVSPIKVDVLGGDTLKVSFDEDLSNVCLIGPAEFVYEGVIEI